MHAPYSLHESLSPKVNTSRVYESYHSRGARLPLSQQFQGPAYRLSSQRGKDAHEAARVPAIVYRAYQMPMGCTSERDY